MKKLKIVVWGINDAILYDIRNELNPEKIEITGFVDSDKSKHGTCYMGIPVTSLQDVNTEKADYYLITALSAYEEIKQELLKIGIPKQKIQIFVTEQLCNYCKDDLDDIDTKFIESVYFNPGRMLEIVYRYQRIYREYTNLEIYQECYDEWFNKSNLISHACGGVINGKRIPYSNSKEAFQYSMESGFKIIECDMCKMKNDEMILLHDYERIWEAEEEGYSMMRVRDLLHSLKKYPEVSCLIDVKWKDYEEYTACVNAVDEIIREIVLDKKEQDMLKGQIVMEVYDEPTIQIARKRNFKVIFTQYRNPDVWCFMNTVNLCYRYGIKVIAIPADWHTLQKINFEIFKSKNIQIYAFSSDSVEEYKALRKRGIRGIFTNYLTEEDIRDIYE